MDITRELTVVIPVRIDCPERKENLDVVIEFFLEHTKSQIIILEADKSQKYSYKKLNEFLSYLFVADNDIVFHRTRYINQLLSLADTDIVGVWDADVLLPQKQIKEGIEAIKKGQTMCIPYDGRALFLNDEKSRELRVNPIEFMDKNTKLRPILGRPSVGGAFLVNKEEYKQAGGENEFFYGWGPEDAERVKRMEILDKPITRVEGVLFHMHHSRGINSFFDNGERDICNLQALIKTCQMNKDELTKYIKTWSHLPKKI